MKLNIPTKVEIAGIVIKTILMTEEDNWDEKNCIGKADYQNQAIIIDVTRIKETETLEQIYYHELLHWLFHIMGEEELQRNEKVIDLLAHFLYQSIGKQVTYESGMLSTSSSQPR